MSIEAALRTTAFLNLRCLPRGSEECKKTLKEQGINEIPDFCQNCLIYFQALVAAAQEMEKLSAQLAPLSR